MTAIIITIILNLLVGTPSDAQKDVNTDSDTETTSTETGIGAVSTMGGTGAWTNVDK